MLPTNLKTKVFLDSGDMDETKTALELLGSLDGQTTNPSLIAKNPDVCKKRDQGQKCSEDEIYNFYKTEVQQLSKMIPNGSISIEVYADKDTPSAEMYKQGKEMNTWIPNAHIKLPITTAGLETAEKFIAEGMRVNMTLCFSQEQAAAVYAATKGAKPGDVFISPFLGRLDDLGQDGIDIIQNILKMYKNSDKHVQVLAASLRNLQHLLAMLYMECNIITAPLKILKLWSEASFELPNENFNYDSKALTCIDYEELDLAKPWQEFNIKHPLTDTGIEKFAADWNALIQH